MIERTDNASYEWQWRATTWHAGALRTSFFSLLLLLFLATRKPLAPESLLLVTSVIAVIMASCVILLIFQVPDRYSNFRNLPLNLQDNISCREGDLYRDLERASVYAEAILVALSQPSPWELVGLRTVTFLFGRLSRRGHSRSQGDRHRRPG